MRTNIILKASDFLQRTNGIDTAVVLNRLAKEKSLDYFQLADYLDISSNRFNSLLNSRKLFILPYSQYLEKILGIDIPDFFPTLEKRYQERIQELAALRKGPDIRNFQKSTFWDVDMATIPWNTPDPGKIIRRVYRYGNEKERQTVLDYYGKEKVGKALETMYLFNRKR